MNFRYKAAIVEDWFDPPRWRSHSFLSKLSHIDLQISRHENGESVRNFAKLFLFSYSLGPWTQIFQNMFLIF